MPAAGVPKLGVGLGYQPQLRRFMEEQGGLFDYVGIGPEAVWNDLGPGHAPRYVAAPSATAFLEAVARTRPLVPHGIGLSLGSAHRLDLEPLDEVVRYHARSAFPWVSDPLAFRLALIDGVEVDLEVPLPVPLDGETLELLAGRVADVSRRLPVPFLVENNAYYFRLAEAEHDEPAFLNELVRRGGCGLLLDLHALHVNATNLGWDAYRYLDRLDLDAVVELRVAGGRDLDGLYLDARSGSPPRAVWELLDVALRRCPRLGGVTFELAGAWYEAMGEESLRRHLGRLRERWARHQPAPERSVA